MVAVGVRAACRALGVQRPGAGDGEPGALELVLEVAHAGRVGADGPHPLLRQGLLRGKGDKDGWMRMEGNVGEACTALERQQRVGRCSLLEVASWGTHGGGDPSVRDANSPPN